MVLGMRRDYVDLTVVMRLHHRTTRDNIVHSSRSENFGPKRWEFRKLR